MATSDGWYLVGPLIALAVVGALGVLFWRLGLDWVDRADDPLREVYGLSIFGDPEDYGLLYPAAVTEEPDEAEEIRLLLVEAGDVTRFPGPRPFRVLERHCAHRGVLR